MDDKRKWENKKESGTEMKVGKKEEKIWKLYEKIKSLLATLKGPFLGLRQFLTTDSSLKLMANVFYFMLKALFVLKIFTFLS